MRQTRQATIKDIARETGLSLATISKYLNGGDEQLFLSSADWMERNLDKRVETCFPVEGKKLITRVKKELESYLTDNTQAWLLQPDGRYQRITPFGNANPRNAQAALLEKLTAPQVR